MTTSQLPLMGAAASGRAPLSLPTRVHLRQHILIPVAVTLLMVMALFLYGADRYLGEVESDHTQSAADIAVNVWREQINQQTERLSWFVARAQNDPLLRQAMERGDAGSLLTLSQAQLHDLAKAFGITHWYFMTPDQRVLLRVHAPGRRGDLIERKTMREAVVGGAAVSGLEVGAMGTFTLRHVAPWRIGDRLIGYIEMGSDVDWFALQVKRQTGLDVVLALQKQYISADTFGLGKSHMGLIGPWSQDPGLVVLRNTLREVPGDLLRQVNELGAKSGATELTVESLSKRWSGAVRDLTDSEGRSVAKLIVLRDVTKEQLASAREMRVAGVVSGMAVLLLLFVLLVRINEAGRRMERADSTMRLAAAAFEGQEGMMVLDVQGNIQQVNHAFTEISGFQPDEVLGKGTRRLWALDKHDRAFYQRIMDTLNETGRWQGELWSRHQDGGLYFVRLCLTLVSTGSQHATYCVAAFSDITARKEAEAQIERLAFYDPLTSLPNRRLLMDRVTHALVSARRNGHMGALLLIDLDHFKTLNDSLGHDRGDELLKLVASRLQQAVRDSDTVGRLGGDEFVVVLENLHLDPVLAVSQAQAVGNKLLQMMSQVFDLAAIEYHGGCSIGVSLFGGQYDINLDELLKQADLAMYAAKAAGRNALRFFDPAAQAEVARRVELEADMRKALTRHEFELFYQPQVNADGTVHGAEALLRWHQPQRGMVSPGEFIPLAEQSGLILPLGQWVLESACRQLVRWSQIPEMAHLSVAVNVSARQFRQADFVALVSDALERTGARPDLLKLELTESMLVDDMELVIDKMAALKVIGVVFSLDDFGTGYSSLHYLKRLPLDQLKIDQSFVRNVMSDGNDAAIVRTIVALADTLGLTVIAEGVETLEQRDFLLAQGCQHFQGYLFGRPVPSATFEDSLRA
ncbi:MAG: EAL domain-containing protein [Aquabacterium sp.]|uniref:bifunctional diguanylate cyclase/phosphodiesterase n=1 Tax=Aquabacterium sp. TaxID=1872578 RepID=UPI003BC715F8